LKFICINEDNVDSSFTLSHLQKICSCAFQSCLISSLPPPSSFLKKSGMSSSSDRVSLLDSGSKRSRDSGSSRDDTSNREEMGSIGRIPVEMVVEIREDPPEELVKSNWPAKARYEWVAADVQT